MRVNFEIRGEQVNRDVPVIFPRLPEDKRYWAQLFGRGIVEAVGEFSAPGRYPTHAKLLDWLAVEFVESGWNTKHILKTILMSSTYRQSSVNDGRHDRFDAGNDFLWRGPRFRLPAEDIRDTRLKIFGTLSPKVGGPPVFPHQSKDLYRGRILTVGELHVWKWTPS